MSSMILVALFEISEAHRVCKLQPPSLHSCGIDVNTALSTLGVALTYRRTADLGQFWHRYLLEACQPYNGQFSNQHFSYKEVWEAEFSNFCLSEGQIIKNGNV